MEQKNFDEQVFNNLVLQYEKGTLVAFEGPNEPNNWPITSREKEDGAEIDNVGFQFLQIPKGAYLKSGGSMVILFFILYGLQGFI